MLLGYDYMQYVTIKNSTGKELTNIILSHNGEGGHHTKIKKLKVDEESTECLYTLKEKYKCDLILSYTYNDLTMTQVVYDKLSCDNKPNITLDINYSEGNFSVNTIIKSNSEIML